MKKQIHKLLIPISFGIIIMIFIASCGNRKNSSIRIKADRENEVVFIDGERIGTAPIDVMVSAGKHKIEIKKENEDKSFYFYKEKIEIADNVSKLISAKLVIDYNITFGSFDNLDGYVNFWNTTEDSGSYAWIRHLVFNDSGMQGHRQ